MRLGIDFDYIAAICRGGRISCCRDTGPWSKCMDASGISIRSVRSRVGRGATRDIGYRSWRETLHETARHALSWRDWDGV